MRQAMLRDFGLAKAMNDESGMTTTESMRGSLRYLSPELLSDEVDLPLKNLFSDVWAWGCVLFEVFPPPCDNMAELALKPCDVTDHFRYTSLWRYPAE